MDGLSAESNALFIAFRRLVYNFSEQMSKEECQAIIYIRLYRLRERYRDSSTLEVLSKLEADGVFSPSNPEGLLEVAKDIKRQDLVSEVKDFMKKKRSKKGAAAQQTLIDKNQCSDDSEEDLQLRATIEVTLAQATVLMQQVEILERAVAGGKAQRQRAKEVISEAGQTAAALADRLKKAQVELGLNGSDAGTVDSNGGKTTAVSIRGRSISCQDQQPFYSNISYGEDVGTFSHSVPNIGFSGRYALQSQSQRRSTQAPDQSTDIHGRSKVLGKLEEEEIEEDDYEKMQSFVTNEEEIKAWRMSLISQANYKSFTPTARENVQTRSSEQFTSQSPRIPPRTVFQPHVEKQVRPSSYAPGSSHDDSTHQHHHHKQHVNRSTNQNSGVATNAPPTHSPWLRHAHNINTNNSSSGGVNATTTTTQVHTPTPIKSRGQYLQILASNQLPSEQATTEQSKDSVERGEPHTPVPPQEIKPSKRRTFSPAANNSRPVPPPRRTIDSPSLKKTATNSVESSDDNRNDAIKSRTCTKQDDDSRESSSLSVVKARLERLEKAATLKPVLSPKPAVAVARPRRNVVGNYSLEHDTSLHKEALKDKHTVKTTNTLPQLSSLQQSSFTKARTQLKSSLQSNTNEDEAYTTLHPSGTSNSMLNTGDSGFEDVRPLQRLDQESPDHKEGSSPPRVPMRPGTYTGLLDQRSTTDNLDGYTEVNYHSSSTM